ncbi:MAG: hypothetical protein H6598_07615 [Flavobacteriales bacterium]|nr:hypothetical protein [Flavobacteriales bacterium]
MRKLGTIISALLLIGVSSAFSQGAVETKVLIDGSQIRNKSEVPHTGEYIIDTEELKKAFISGEIHPDFPKYDPNLSRDKNESIAREWASNHKELFTEEVRGKYQIK